MNAEDLPPVFSRTWLSWRWWWHVSRGGRIGTYCRSSACRPCRRWREYMAGARAAFEAGAQGFA
jgi:hypothetical protein